MCSSDLYVLELPGAACGPSRRWRSWDLPVPVRGVSGRARGLRPRGVPSRLALATRRVWPSAYLHGVGTPEWSKISRLDTRPARTPVNASPPASRPSAHDSGPVWVATPSPYDSSIRCTSPVLTGARRYCGDGVTTSTVTPSSFERLAEIRRDSDVDRARRPLEPAPGARRLLPLGRFAPCTQGHGDCSRCHHL